MAPVYPPGCLQDITITDPTSLDGSGLLEISLIPTRGVTDINVFSKEGLNHMKEMLEGADEEMDQEIQGAQKDIGLILLGVEEDDPREFIDDEEVEEALEQWRMCVGMDDLHEPSYFSDHVGFPGPVGSESPGFAMMKKMGWSPGEGLGQGGIVDPICKMIPSLLRDDRGNVVKFSPEILEQREQLNWNFNFLWNGFGFCEGTTNHPTGDYVPPIHCEDVELVSVGDNHGVGKCKMGSVFIPKGALNYLGPDAAVGQGIQATLERANEGARYPWRIVKNGITCVGITYAK